MYSLGKLGLERFHTVTILGFNSAEWFFSAVGAVFAGWDTNAPKNDLIIMYIFIWYYLKILIYFMMVCNSIRGIMTGIYATNSPEACYYVAHDSRANIIVVENQKQLDKILQVIILFFMHSRPVYSFYTNF